MVRATTTHFSEQAAFGGTVGVSLWPRQVKAKVGEEWIQTAAVWATSELGEAVEIVDWRPRVGSAGVLSATPYLTPRRELSPGGEAEAEFARFQCVQAGTDTFGVEVEMRAQMPTQGQAALAWALFTGKDGPIYTALVAFDLGSAECVDDAGAQNPGVTAPQPNPGVNVILGLPGAKPPGLPAVKEPATLTVLNADNQTGLAGQLLPQPIRLRLQDSQGTGIPNWRLALEVLSGPPVTGEFLHTDSLGNAVIKVRAPAGAAGAGSARVRAEGLNGAEAVIQYKLVQPQIDVISRTEPALSYGKTYRLELAYDGDGNHSTRDYEPDTFRPVRLDIHAGNLRVTQRQVVLGQNGRATIGITPATFDGSAWLTIRNADDPSVPFQQIRWQV